MIAVERKEHRERNLNDHLTEKQAEEYQVSDLNLRQAMSSAFFYGTLLHPKILKRVIGNDGGHLEVCPAVLMDHTRHHIKHADYPAVIPYEKSSKLFERDLSYEERSVRGTLVTGLTKSDIDLLDIFEGDEYTRTPVSVHPLAPFKPLSSSEAQMDEVESSVAPPTVPQLPPISELAPVVFAETYIWTLRVSDLKKSLWSYETFIKENAWKWVGTNAEENEDYKEASGTSFRSILIFLILLENVSRQDFSQYAHVRNISAEELSLDNPGKRALIVGDIHGMNRALVALLEKVSYSSKTDTLIHTGDICSKGPHAGSLSVLSFMASNNITGVRGNHDQKVIEWRAWLDWVKGLEKGKGGKWLDEVEALWEKENESDDLDEEKWVEKQKQKAKRKDRKWWKRIPDGWTMFSDHYRIARAMSSAEYAYLRSLPLILHLPSEHAFLVHAGLLPYDPTRSLTNRRQPLAHLPSLSQTLTDPSLLGLDWPSNARLRPTVPIYRQAQEVNIINDIAQNRDPWVLLNMRGVSEDNTVSRDSHEGTPWAEIWNGMVSRCGGYKNVSSQQKPIILPCHPATVIYGHTASRGLDVNRWTIGLDSGCVYGRRLTVMILDAAHQHRNDVVRRAANDDLKGKSDVIDFGDDGHARLVSVDCIKHKK
ncbi:hypothetical protein EW146_g4815 [Bondarzewia mesenterica]|uniref:Calcineurin-like phosphoesterase domain-containing protein n=1 Tax=Bondarzewia mesenterica TaxID=1095465 RepID=A0A4S4LTD5_9AGAM|nr:hypothetical protein EW146_g4815 [Bondarzewia mesenterica]